MRQTLAAFGLVVAGCQEPTPRVTLRLEIPAELGVDDKLVVIEPRSAELARMRSRGVVALDLRRASVRIVAPGACPLELDLRGVEPGRVQRRALKSLFELGPRERVVGLAKDFTISASPNCDEAARAQTSFVVSAGASLERLTLTTDGRTLSATTRATLPDNSRVPGIVPVSAAEQRKLRTELTFRAELADGLISQRVLGVSAVARSSGLPNVGLSHPLLLSGQGWQLRQQPPASLAQLREAGGLLELRPDVPGRYRLEDARGRELSVHSGRFDQMPLDCGRGDCHAEVTKAAATSAMTQTLASDLGGCHSLERPECATACHTTGEPGTDDGGFSQVQTALGLLALPPEYEQLPHALQRLSGVGCMACHGPAAIPEPSARWAIMRSDVCAVCHDSAPRYGHVQAFQTSAMAHADRDARARQEPACARCHTSWGAVGRAAPPHEVGGFGLTCSTCHAVHAPTASKQPTRHGLLRDFPLPATLPSPPASYLGVSKVCISCHAPSSATSPPEASAAALVAGQGGLEPSSGQALTLAGPHATNPKACLSCHDSGPEELVFGKSHGFRSSQAACARCHQVVPARDPGIAERARSLFARLEPGVPGLGPPHALAALATTPERGRASYDIRLVLEDPAADVHHPAYARALLDAAEPFTVGAPP